VGGKESKDIHWKVNWVGQGERYDPVTKKREVKFCVVEVLDLK
jgi:hypothetical protein